MEYSQTQIIILKAFQKSIEYNCPFSRVAKPALLPDCRFLSDNLHIVLFVQRSAILILIHKIKCQVMTKVPSRLCILHIVFKVLFFKVFLLYSLYTNTHLHKYKQPWLQASTARLLFSHFLNKRCFRSLLFPEICSLLFSLSIFKPAFSSPLSLLPLCISSPLSQPSW